MNPDFTTKTVDPESEEKILTFSGAPANNEVDGTIIFGVEREDEFSKKTSRYEEWYNLSMCEAYKEAFHRKTGQQTCPVKWFYEQHFNFSRPFHPDACIVDRALNNRPIQKWEIEPMNKLPLAVCPTRPMCGRAPYFRDEVDVKLFVGLQKENIEYLIKADFDNMKDDIVLHGF